MAPSIRQPNATSNSNTTAATATFIPPTITAPGGNDNKKSKEKTLDDSSDLKELLNEAAEVFSEYIKESTSNDSDVIRSEPVESTMAKLNLSLQKDGINKSQLWDEIRGICQASTHTWNKGFLYKLYASPSPIGVVSEALMGLLNNNAHVYNSAPAGTIIEATLGAKLSSLANFPPTAAGITFPGGSYSNIHALMVARNKHFPELKTKGYSGLSGVRPVIFTSIHAHYSIEKAAVAAGIGLDNVIHVPTDGRGCMDPDALRAHVKEAIVLGGTPFFVNATTGTTVLGAFDPVSEISKVCEEYSLWLHVDGSWGAPLALFADPEHFSFEFPEGKIDSFTVNPHKLMGIPLQCSYLIVREGLGVMKEALGLNADYLFHQTDSDNVQSSIHGNDDPSMELDLRSRLGGSWDVGDATMGCGRRPDSLKLWITWRYYGTQYFVDRTTHARKIALRFSDMIQTRESSNGKWLLFAKPESVCVCFWFIPTDAGIPHSQHSALKLPYSLGSITKDLCALVNRRGKVLIDYATVGLFRKEEHNEPNTQTPFQPGEYQTPEFFRIPFNNPNANDNVLDLVLSEIESAAKTLYLNN